VYRREKEKFEAIAQEVMEYHERGQPVLVGTISIEKSERLSRILKSRGVKHHVLNAKFHEKEAEIISQAGGKGAVTLATNMAGRGTDIVLGGALEERNEEDADEQREALQQNWQYRHDRVVAAGGLHIIGTERHESRRVDNQLRGRSGRQGDPGSSRFYLSLEDSLIRIFASEKMAALMQRLGMKEGEVIEHPWVTKAIGNAQRKVEARNFDIRKHLLEFDNVINDQRTVVYGQRDEIMGAEDLSANVRTIRDDRVVHVFQEYIPPDSMEEEWNASGLEQAVQENFRLALPLREWLDQEHELVAEGLLQRIQEAVEEVLDAKEAQLTSPTMRQLEKDLLLATLDAHWKEHLALMDHLRQGIGLRSYAQKNPKQEYKREAFEMFQQMLDRIEEDFVRTLYLLQLQSMEELGELEKPATPMAELDYGAEPPPPDFSASEPAPAPVRSVVAPPPIRRRGAKVGRNQPCPCGSGKKFKRCCGAAQSRQAV